MAVRVILLPPREGCEVELSEFHRQVEPTLCLRIKILYENGFPKMEQEVILLSPHTSSELSCALHDLLREVAPDDHMAAYDRVTGFLAENESWIKPI